MSINSARPFGICAVLRGTYEKSGLHLPGRLWRLATQAFWAVVVLSCVAVLSSAQATIKINEYALSQSQINPWGLTSGPDGAVWFTESCPSFFCGTNTHDGIGRITTAGVITEYPLPDGNSPYGITAGPDGALWFTEPPVNKIGRITTDGVITEYPLPTPNTGPYEITAGPDGALWFTESIANKIGRITTTGVVTEYLLDWVCCSPGPTDIVAGPERALWFTNVNSNWIGRITTQGDVTKYPIPVPSPDYGIAVGPDNALWFTGGVDGNAVIWRMTTNGVFSMYSVPTKDAALVYIALGPDNALWFTEQYSSQIGRVTSEGVFTEYPSGATGGVPVAIATGPGSAVWFGKLGYIDQIILPDTSPPVVTVRADPRILWPPDRRMVTVTVSGTITDIGSGLRASSVEYAVTDEYGVIQPRGHLTLDPVGNYSLTLSLRASREDTDNDGRHYYIRVSARDNANNRGVNWSIVEVPHQRR